MGMGEGAPRPPEGVIGAILHAADAAGLGLTVAKIDGETLTHLWVNDSACAIMGRSREAVLGGSSYLAVAPEEMPRLQEMRLRRLRGEPTDSRFETVVLRPDGRRVPI